MADWITTDEASQLSGYSIVHLRDLIRQKKIEAVKKGSAYWVKHASLTAYIEAAAAANDKRHGARGKTGD